MEIDTDDMDFIEERIKSDLKPVVVKGNLRYEFYKNWNDYANTIKELFYQQFITYLDNAQRDYQEKLNHFTIGQLMAFFESFYGKDHNMTQKFKYYSNAIGLSSEDPKWSEAKRDKRLFKYRVVTKISPYNYRIDYKD